MNSAKKDISGIIERAIELLDKSDKMSIGDRTMLEKLVHSSILNDSFIKYAVKRVSALYKKNNTGGSHEAKAQF